MKNRTLVAALVIATSLSAHANSVNSDNSAILAIESVTQSTIYQVDDVLENGASLLGKEIELEGVCTHICKHGGRKIFLMGSDDKQTIRIESGKLGRFDQKCVNSIVKVKGKLVESRIDEAYLKAWEERDRAQTAEKHGESEAGCTTEKKARGESGNTVADRIAAFRSRIKSQEEKTGKAYLSFYHIEALSYNIQ